LVLQMPWRLLIFLTFGGCYLNHTVSSQLQGRRCEVSELEIRWPGPEETSGRWCGSGTRSASIETILISCDEKCHLLLRYWIFTPMSTDVEENIPLETLKNGRKIGEENIVARKEKTSMYIQTPVVLLTIPNDAEIRVFESSVKIPHYTGRDWRSPQVIYVKGSLSGWKRIGLGAYTPL